MSMLASTYSAFIESVCTKFDCRDALSALQEGFRAYCEARSDGWFKQATKNASR